MEDKMENCKKLEAVGIRAECDLRNEKIGYKIREAQGQKIPVMLVVGDKEAESGTVSVRTRKGEQSVEAVDALIERLCADVAAHKNN